MANYMANSKHQSALSGRIPNVMLILMDDMGFSDPGCYGGEIRTENIDELAESGLRFSHFYNTGRCWPTRSSILTGMYAPVVRMDPPERENRPEWQRLIPHYLRRQGYRSYHSGKWHLMNTPDPEGIGGFDRSWGYDIEQFTHFFGEGEQTKFSATAITDHALECLEEHQSQHSGTPFFHYVCYTTPHFPVQAEQADIDRYRDVYMEGWDVMRQRRWERLKAMGVVTCALSEREADVMAPYYKKEYGQQYGDGEIEYAVPWESLTDKQKHFQATKMAIHAAMVDRTDREIGRILAMLRDMGVYDDTLILFLSDNGASAEIMIRGAGHDPNELPGSPKTHLCLGPGWSSCANAPFRRHKIWVHEGGVATPLIASWPNGITTPGELRHDLGHCVDFLPTILECAGMNTEDIPLPENSPPLCGTSLVPTLERDGSVERSHIYFHHEGNRALRVGDWKIVSSSKSNRGKPEDPWALYDLSIDRCEMVDLADDLPEKCEEMSTLWHEYETLYRTGYR